MSYERKDLILVMDIIRKEITSGIASEKSTLHRRVTHNSAVTPGREEYLLVNIAWQGGLFILSKVMLREGILKGGE